jgi:shikimate dehydrogenase
MGSPIGHSLSPALHLAAYRSLGLPSWTYIKQEVQEAGLAGALDALGPEWVGVSLTMPLKHAVLPLLDELTELASAVGAVNTVTLGEGRRRGDNTDVYGIVAALRDAGCSSAGQGPDAVLLGGGATAASALAAMQELGNADPVVVVRSPERAGLLMAAAERLGARPRLVTWDRAAEVAGSAAVVVSTVPPGAADGLLPAGLRTSGVLLDVVYRPWPTALAAAWTAGGGVAVPGLAMLVHQAAAQVRAWTGRSPDLTAMREAVRPTGHGL